MSVSSVAKSHVSQFGFQQLPLFRVVRAPACVRVPALKAVSPSFTDIRSSAAFKGFPRLHVFFLMTVNRKEVSAGNLQSYCPTSSF